MWDHALLKQLHQGTVVLSISGFLWRGGLMLVDSPLLYRRWMRTWPHLIDTLLLTSGVWMAANLHLNPLTTPWLAAKLLALLAYIALGFIALRLGRSRAQRMAALAAAVACFGYIALVAVRHSVVPL